MSSELGRRVAFTLGALLIYRIGAYIPLPGIDPTAWDYLFRSQQGGILGALNASSGAIGRFAIFALGITPYVSAAIILQLASLVFARLRAQRRRGEAGRLTVERYTLILTMFIALFQAWGLALAIESLPNTVVDPGWPFRTVAVLTMAGGTVFLVWLCGQITLRGIGNGIALIFCADVVVELPQTIAGTLELGRQGLLSSNLIMGTAILAVALVGVATFMEKARRNVPVAFSGRTGAGNESSLSFKLNGAGWMPALIASWLLLVPALAVVYLADTYGRQDPFWWNGVRQAFNPGQPAFIICYAIIIVCCVFLYTAFVLDPAEAAAKLASLGGVIPGVPPGEATADHLDRVLSRVTLIGALYVVAVCLIPELLISRTQVPFYLGGASLLILVCTVLDVEKQARAIAHLEGGFRQ